MARPRNFQHVIHTFDVSRAVTRAPRPHEHQAFAQGRIQVRCTHEDWTVASVVEAPQMPLEAEALLVESRMTVR